MMTARITDAPWRVESDGRHGWRLVGAESDTCARGMSQSDAQAVYELVNAAFGPPTNSAPATAIRVMAHQMLSAQTKVERMAGAEALSAVIVLEQLVETAFRAGFEVGANPSTSREVESDAWKAWAAEHGLGL